MPPTRIAYVDQPYAGKRHTPDTSRLSALYQRGGEQLADLSVQRGQNSARLFDRLGAIFSGYQELGRQEKAAKAATALRAQERADDRTEKQKDRDERKAERDEAQRLSRETQDRSAAERGIDNLPPGPVDDTPENRVLMQMAARWPESAARFRRTTTLPARPVDPSMPAMAPPAEMAVRVPTGPEARQALQDTAARDLAAQAAKDRQLAAADRDADNVRANAQLGLSRRMADIAQQNANTSATSAQARIGGNTGDLSPVYRNALERVLLNVPANRRGARVTQANRLWTEQNEPELKDFIRQSAIEGENVDTKNQVLGRMATVASLKDTTAILNEMKAKGVPTGFFAGTAEDLVRKLGKTTNPEYVALSNRLAGTLINYRRAATGVAFGEKEGAQYAKMFPNYKNDLPVNLALIQGLEREMSTYDRVYWEHKLGKDGADLIIGAPAIAATAPKGVTVLSITPVGKP